MYSGAGATLATTFVRVIPYSTTQFRIAAALNNGSVNVINGEWFHFTLGVSMRYEVDFTFESSN